MANESEKNSTATTIGIIVVVLLAVVVGAYLVNNTQEGANLANDVSNTSGNLAADVREGTQNLGDRIEATGNRIESSVDRAIDGDADDDGIDDNADADGGTDTDTVIVPGDIQ